MLFWFAAAALFAAKGAQEKLEALRRARLVHVLLGLGDNPQLAIEQLGLQGDLAQALVNADPRALKIRALLNQGDPENERVALRLLRGWLGQDEVFELVQLAQALGQPVPDTWLVELGFMVSIVPGCHRCGSSDVSWQMNCRTSGHRVHLGETLQADFCHHCDADWCLDVVRFSRPLPLEEARRVAGELLRLTDSDPPEVPVPLGWTASKRSLTRDPGGWPARIEVFGPLVFHHEVRNDKPQIVLEKESDGTLAWIAGPL